MLFKNSRVALFLHLLLVSIGPLHAQINFGLQLPDGKQMVEIPFTYRNGFIIVEVKLGKVFPLNFILDTGAEYSILSEKSIGDLLGLRYSKTYKIVGTDLGNELEAHLSKIELDIGPLSSSSEDILVLDENIFDFESFTGENIYGIIGAYSFRNYVLQIDYRREKLIFYQKTDFRPNSKKYKEIPIEIYKNKPFLVANYMTSMGQHETIKLLVDTGANIPFLLQRDSVEMSKISGNLIPGIIASGLGGDLRGYVGRTNFLTLDEFGFSGVVTNFQVIEDFDQADYLNNRNGIIGNPLLSRFDIILDYINEKMYIRPNKTYKRKFNFDLSGLQVITSNRNRKNFTVYDVFPGTPASEAGIIPGDEIISINGLSAKLFRMEYLVNKLQRRPGKRIKLKYLRMNEKRMVEFRLREFL